MNVTQEPEAGLDLTPVGVLPRVGRVPRKMHAWAIRVDRHGEPSRSFQREILPVPRPGPGEVLVQVMAAGVNYNAVWAGLGKPISVFHFHAHPTHVAGSDASGVVWEVGPGVQTCRVGDEVVLHCNYEDFKIWGYETPHGAFAQYALVKAQQVLSKPPDLTWEEAASYGLTYYSAYRMLVTQAALQPGENVLVWGAAGGLGVYAIQLCRLMGANVVGVTSSQERGESVVSLGAKGYLNRRDYPDLAMRDAETPQQHARRLRATKAFGNRLRELFGDNRGPDVVFEHVGKETFPASVLLANKRGRIVICGATTGYELSFDVRHLWMDQKRILGSHFASPEDCLAAHRLILQKRVQPLLTRLFEFDQIPEAHDLLLKNELSGNPACLVGSPQPGLRTLRDVQEAFAGRTKALEAAGPAFAS